MSIWKNNFVKLPVFLLGVGALCAASLSVVNFFTSKQIAENERLAQIKAYSDAFKDLYEDGQVPNFTVVEETVATNLSDLGITAKVTVKDGENEVGKVYAGDVQGYADRIKFIVSFEDGKYHNFSTVYHNESAPKGIEYIISSLKDYSVTDPNFFETDEYKTGVAGASKTGQLGLIDALNACAADYSSTLGA